MCYGDGVHESDSVKIKHVPGIAMADDLEK